MPPAEYRDVTFSIVRDPIDPYAVLNAPRQELPARLDEDEAKKIHAKFNAAYADFTERFRRIKAQIDETQRNAWGPDRILSDGGLDLRTCRVERCRSGDAQPVGDLLELGDDLL